MGGEKRETVAQQETEREQPAPHGATSAPGDPELHAEASSSGAPSSAPPDVEGRATGKRPREVPPAGIEPHLVHREHRRLLEMAQSHASMVSRLVREGLVTAPCTTSAPPSGSGGSSAPPPGSGGSSAPPPGSGGGSTPPPGSGAPSLPPSPPTSDPDDEKSPLVLRWDVQIAIGAVAILLAFSVWICSPEPFSRWHA